MNPDSRVNGSKPGKSIPVSYIAGRSWTTVGLGLYYIAHRHVRASCKQKENKCKKNRNKADEECGPRLSSWLALYERLPFACYARTIFQLPRFSL